MYLQKETVDDRPCIKTKMDHSNVSAGRSLNTSGRADWCGRLTETTTAGIRFHRDGPEVDREGRYSDVGRRSRIWRATAPTGATQTLFAGFDT